jgi:hypothetical protein
VVKSKIHIKRTKLKKETLFIYYTNYQYSRFKYSTSNKLILNFESYKSKSKETKQFPEYPEFNTRLDKIENAN